MYEYRITFARTARKELEKLEVEIVTRIWDSILQLGNEPKPEGVKKLKGVENHYRIRIGDYRAIYMINDSEKIVDIIAIRHRRDAYR